MIAHIANIFLWLFFYELIFRKLGIIAFTIFKNAWLKTKDSPNAENK